MSFINSPTCCHNLSSLLFSSQSMHGKYAFKLVLEYILYKCLWGKFQTVTGDFNDKCPSEVVLSRLWSWICLSAARAERNRSKTFDSFSLLRIARCGFPSHAFRVRSRISARSFPWLFCIAKANKELFSCRFGHPLHWGSLRRSDSRDYLATPLFVALLLVGIGAACACCNIITNNTKKVSNTITIIVILVILLLLDIISRY